jgi:uncharacterized protein (DUF2062 family)
MVATLMLMNPLTVVPVYFLAYRVGALLLGQKPGQFAFELSWTWLQNGLGAFWQPFLIGCLVCGLVGGYLTYQAMELAWRYRTLSRLNARRGNIRP